MKRPIVVFDFDKTLTERDTIFGYYHYVSNNGISFKIKYFFLILLAVLAKVKIISNFTLKHWGIMLYLRKKERNAILQKGKEYASKIKMNSIYANDFRKYQQENVIIISASFEAYLKPLFPELMVAGSKISFDKDGLVNGLERNLYGEKKHEWLQQEGIDAIDVLYTDSYSDKPLMDIAKCVYLIENDEKKLIKGEDSWAEKIMGN